MWAVRAGGQEPQAWVRIPPRPRPGCVAVARPPALCLGFLACKTGTLVTHTSPRSGPSPWVNSQDSVRPGATGGQMPAHRVCLGSPSSHPSLLSPKIWGLNNLFQASRVQTDSRSRAPLISGNICFRLFPASVSPRGPGPEPHALPAQRGPVRGRPGTRRRALAGWLRGSECRPIHQGCRFYPRNQPKNSSISGTPNPCFSLPETNQ